MDVGQLILSIVPPFLAIVLALITKEVISSLLVGILAGTLIYNKGNVVAMVTTVFELMGSKIGENAMTTFVKTIPYNLYALLTILHFLWYWEAFWYW